ncbi:hypothetical protein AB4Z46_02610 [Variovorax sp. M-6]|uniref:hypothetical protein n=1 Tax=Variovorax sp. M-6 TaxID=3233041 RepID=UPI003F94C4D9
MRELLRVLSDCGASNADTTADMRVESVAVLLRDLGEQLAKAEPLIDGMAAIGRDEAPGSDLSDAIEAQGRIVFSVRHTFCALYDVIGHRCRDHHAFDVEAFTGTVHRLADCLQGVEATLFELAFGRKPMTSRPSVAPGTAAPAAAVPGATVKAPTRRTAVRPLRRPGRLARAAWRIQPLQAGAAA